MLDKIRIEYSISRVGFWGWLNRIGFKVEIPTEKKLTDVELTEISLLVGRYIARAVDTHQKRYGLIEPIRK